MEELLSVDTQLFLWINTTLSNSFFDWFLPIIRDKIVWIPLYVFIIAFILFNTPIRHALTILGVVAGTMAVSDLMSSSIIKPTVERVRPCNDESLEGLMVERVRCGGGYSFTSSHATNHFTLATFLFLLIGRPHIWRWLLVIWATGIALAQVYVGVHYPLDILCGSMLGIGLGQMGIWILKLFSKK